MKLTNEQIQALRDKFETAVMKKICISKSTLIGLRTDEGYRNSTLSGHDYQGDWEFFLAGYSCSLAERDADKALIVELSAHLRNAHAFIENTEAFGGEAATGIISCGGAEWNIDASKAALSNSPDISSTTPHVGEWAIDHSAGRPILTYKNCSVIEAEDAEFVLSLISQHQRNNELEARTLTVKLPYSIPCPTAPETIWLQTNGADSEESRWPTSDDDVSWCRDKIFTNDTLYVRADCAAAGITLVVGE